MMRLVFSSILGMTVCASSALQAATVNSDANFVFAFAVVNGTQTQNVALDPFAGAAADLTGVTLEFTSQIAGTNITAGDWSAAVLLDGVTLSTTLFPAALEEFSFTQDLFAAGFTAADFVGGPVTLTLSAFADEGGYTGVWHAGTGVPFLGLDPFGGVRLVYEYSEPAQIPLPAGAPLILGGFGVLAALRLRKR